MANKLLLWKVRFSLSASDWNILPNYTGLLTAYERMMGYKMRAGGVVVKPKGQWENGVLVDEIIHRRCIGGSYAIVLASSSKKATALVQTVPKSRLEVPELLPRTKAGVVEIHYVTTD